MFNAGIRGYSGARGVLGALKARGPRPELVEELLNMSDAETCATYVRSMPFLGGADAGSDLASLEAALRGGCMAFGRKIAKFLGGVAEELVSAHLLRYSVHNVKVLFRRALSGGGSCLQFPGAAVYASPRELPGLDSVEKVVDFTQGTPLEKPVRFACEVYKSGNGDVFLFELALDSRYSWLVWDAARRVSLFEGSRLAQRVIIPYLGTRALVWFFWLRTHGGMKPEEVMTRLQVPADLVRAQQCMDLLNAEDASQAASVLRTGALGSFLEAGHPLDSVSAWEKSSRRFVWNSLSEKDLGILFDIATLFVALLRWEFIVDDAITVLNGKALGLSRDEIAPLLATQAA